VINELEGLSRGGKLLAQTNSLTATLATGLALFPEKNNVPFLGRHQDPEHAARVAEWSKAALQFLKSKHLSVK
jgi:hypothetical protein